MGIPLRALLEAVAAAARLDLEIEGHLDKPTSIALERLPLRGAIDQLLSGRSFLLRLPASHVAGSRGLLMVFGDRQPGSPEREPTTRGATTDVLGLERWLADLHDDDPRVRLRAVAELAQIGGDPVTDAIADVALLDSAVAVREEAIHSLAEIGSEVARRFLEPALVDLQPRIREAAIDALSRFDDENAAWSLAFLIVDENPELRMEAVYALGEIRGEAARTILQRALSDPDGAIVDAAVEALEDLSD